MAWGNRTTVAQADVEFHAETGQFEAEVTTAKRIFSQAVDSMSDEALRMSVAQEKVDRAISRFGPESIQARQAAVAYRKELSQLRHEEDRVAHSARRASSDITRVGRGAIAASGAFKGLGNALFFASGAFAGGFGLIYALRTTIQAAARAQVANVRLAQAVRNSGIAWRENRKQILDVIDAQSKLTAFDDEELKDSLAGFIIRTKDVNEALRLNGLAADIARARNISLDAAMRLVTRASLGQTSSLRRLGIDVEKVTTNQDRLRAAGVKVTFQQRQQAKAADEAATRLAVVTQLEAKFGNQAEKFAKTAAGRQEYFNKVLEDTQEIVGVGLLPTVNRLLTQFSDWLDEMNKTGQTQKEVNRLIDEGSEIVHGFVDAFKLIKGAAEPFIDLMGGLHNTVEALVGLWVAFKIKAVLGFVATAAASRRTSASGIADAAAFGRAWDVATRPRFMTVTTTTSTTGVPGAPVPGGKPPLIPPVLMSNLAIATVVAILAASGASGAKEGDRRALKEALLDGKLRNGLPYLTDAYQRAAAGQATPQEMAIIRGIPDGEGVTAQQMAAGFRVAEKKLRALSTPRKPHGSGGKPADATTPTGGGTAPPKPRTAVDIQLDISRAQARDDETAELRYHRELIALYQRQAHNLERRKHLTLLQKQRLQQLYNDIESEQSAVESIISGQQSDARAASARRTAAARRRHQQHKDKVDAHIAFLENQVMRAAETEGLKDDRIWMKKLMAAYRAAAHDAELTAKERAAYEKKRLTARARAKAAREKATEERLDIRERKLRNAVAAAELTEGIKDDVATLKKLIAFYRAEEHNRNLAEKAREEARRKRIAAQKKLKKAIGDDTKKGGVQSGAEFLTSLQGTLNTYGGNLFGFGELKVGGRFHDGAATAHAIINTSLLRDQNRILRDLSDQVRTPASAQGYTNMTSLFDGYATG